MISSSFVINVTEEMHHPLNGWTCFRHPLHQSFCRVVPGLNPAGVAVNGTVCYDMVYDLFLHTTFANRCESHTPSVHCWVEKPTPVRRRLSLTPAGPEKLIPGGTELTLAINWWCRKVLYCHCVLQLQSAQCAVLTGVRGAGRNSAAGAWNNQGKLILI